MSFRQSSGPSVRPQETTRIQLDGFSWNLILVFSENLSRKFNFIKIWKIINELVNKCAVVFTLREDQCIFMIISRLVLIRTRIFQTKLAEEIKIHILCSVFLIFFFFSPENRGGYKIMLKNFVDLDRPKKTVWRMRIACCITKCINTHSCM